MCESQVNGCQFECVATAESPTGHSPTSAGQNMRILGDILAIVILMNRFRKGKCGQRQ